MADNAGSVNVSVSNPTDQWIKKIVLKLRPDGRWDGKIDVAPGQIPLTPSDLQRCKLYMDSKLYRTYHAALMLESKREQERLRASKAAEDAKKLLTQKVG